MKVLTIIFILVVALVSSSDVVKLTDENFKETISKNKYVMVKFYAPWCGHCMSMAPEYEKLAELIKDNGVVVGELDATEEKTTATEFQVTGYPTVKLFIEGTPVEYEGERTSELMYEWIKKVSEIKLEAINSEKLQELKKSQNIAVYFGTDENKLKILHQMIFLDSHITYFTSTQASADNDKLILFFEGQIKEFPSGQQFTKQELNNWIFSKTVPDVVSLSKKQFLDWVFYDQKTMKDAFLFLQQSDLNQQVYSTYEKICKNNKDKFKCSHATEEVEIYSGVRDYLKGKGESVLALIRNGFQQAYNYPSNLSELTEQSIFNFIEQVNKQTHTNIAEKPEQQEQKQPKIHYENVKQLNQQTFEEFIKTNNVVLVEFYSKQCHYCIQFAPRYQAMATKAIEQEKDYVIASIDGSVNIQLTKSVNITSYPSFVLYFKGEAIRYQGSRAEESLIGLLDSLKDEKVISVRSIAEVPIPAVVLYGPIEQSNLQIIPALFTRYPVYHLNEGTQIKVVLRKVNTETYLGDLKVYEVSAWLNQKTEPILFNFLLSNEEKKLVKALENKTPLLGLVDIDAEISEQLTKILEQFCQNKSSIICWYAKKGEENFEGLAQWAGLTQNNQSQIIYIDTQNFNKYLFNRPILELSQETIEQFVKDTVEGVIPKLEGEEEYTQKETNQANSEQSVQDNQENNVQANSDQANPDDKFDQAQQKSSNQSQKREAEQIVLSEL